MSELTDLANPPTDVTSSPKIKFSPSNTYSGSVTTLPLTLLPCSPCNLVTTSYTNVLLIEGFSLSVTLASYFTPNFAFVSVGNAMSYLSSLNSPFI